jgi:hypothetical protein
MSENNDWISVKERMPDINDSVLIYSQSAGMYLAHLYDVNEYGRKSARKHKDKWPIRLEWRIEDYCCYGSLMLNEVTHWMPLPKPPEESV